MKTLFQSYLLKISLSAIALLVLNQCKTPPKKIEEKDRSTAPTELVKSEVWLQYLKRGPASSQFAELPIDSNRFLIIDYKHISLYLNSQLQFEDSLIIHGESDSFLVYNFNINNQYQLGLNKIDSTIILTNEKQANGIPLGILEYFKKKQPVKDAFGN